MSCRQLPFFNPILNLRLQLQEPDRIGHGCAILAGPLRNRFLGQLRFVHQAFKGTRSFNGIQIFALDVFHQRHFEGQFVRYLADDDRDFRQASALRGAPAALAGNQLKPRTNRSNDQRLDDAAGLNGTC